MRVIQYFTMRLTPDSLRLLSMRALSDGGFEVDEVRSDAVQLRYAHQGGVALVSLSTQSPGLEVVDPPTSVHPLLSQLAVIAGHSVPVAPISVDPLDWLASLESRGYRALVTRMELSVRFPRGVRGSLVLEADRDVRRTAAAAVGSKDHRVQRVLARLRLGDSATDLSLEGGARVGLPGARLSDFAGDVRGALIRSSRVHERTA